MQEPITVRETFLSRDEAEEARERLEYGGFARNSMNIMRVGDQFESSIRTRLENRQRAQECLDEVSGAFETGWYGREVSEYTPSAARSVLLVGVIAAIGAGLYYALTRQRDIYAHTYPSRQRSAVRGLYRAHREPVAAPEQKPDCDLPENSKANLDRKLDHALTETFPTSDPVSVSITR